MSLVIYDIEIEKAIPDPKVARLAHIEYCQGWGDHKGMGIACICAYVWGEGYRVFLHDNIVDFLAIADSADNMLIDFGGRSFDRKLLLTWGVDVPDARHFDFMREAGDQLSMAKWCDANNLAPKSMDGAQAPIAWQEGHRGRVIDYCLGDVIRLKKLVEAALAGKLRSPVNFRLMQMDVTRLLPHAGML